MKKYIKYLVQLNCILIEEDVRECFLFWCKKTLKIIEYINRSFPNLIINESDNINVCKEFKTCDVILVSKRIIYPHEYDSDAKLGKLLGYLSADNYKNLNRNETLYDYSFETNIDDTRIILFNEMSQNKLDHSNTLFKINQAINKHFNLLDVVLRERVIIPLKYTIERLDNNHKLSDLEYEQLKYINKNVNGCENTNKIIKFLKQIKSNGKDYICMTDPDILQQIL
jgi:hypothetical protein